MAAPMSRFVNRIVHRKFKDYSLPAFSRHKLLYLSVLNTKKFTNVYLQVNVLPKLKPVFRGLSDQRHARKCWKCSKLTNEETDLFFCKCGVVQAVPSDLDYFEVMALPHSFDIDINNLTKLYKDLQWKLHPDKFSQKSKEEQTHAAIQSSFINKAYFTLLKPLSRGLYLLELQGNPVDEKNTSVDPEFLMEIMEINEDVIEVASKSVVLTEIENVNRSKMDACIKLISKAFKEDDILVAKEQLVKLKYYSKVDDTIKDVHRSKMG